MRFSYSYNKFNSNFWVPKLWSKLNLYKLISKPRDCSSQIKTLKDLKHFHRKRDDSVSFTENKGSYKSLQDYRQKILNL